MVRTRSSVKGLEVILVLTRSGGGGGRGGAPRVVVAGVCGWIPHVLRVTQGDIGPGGARGVLGLMWLLSGSWNARWRQGC